MKLIAAWMPVVMKSDWNPTPLTNDEAYLLFLIVGLPFLGWFLWCVVKTGLDIYRGKL